MEALSKKGTPAPVGAGTGAGMARLAPRARLPSQVTTPFRPVSVSADTGPGLDLRADYRPAAAGRGYQQHQDDIASHAALADSFAPCQAQIGKGVAVRCLYILVFRSPQRFVGRYAHTRNCPRLWAASARTTETLSQGHGEVRLPWSSNKGCDTKRGRSVRYRSPGI